MGTVDERQLRAIMRTATVRNKSLLLVSNLIEIAIGRDPILTESEVHNIRQSLTDNERRECAAILRGSLSFCVIDAEHRYNAVTNRLTMLDGYFSLAAEYRQFESFLNELCLKKDRDINERLRERAVSVGRSELYSYNITTKEESDGNKFIALALSDRDLALISEVTQDVVREASGLKAVTQVIRDVTKECTGLIDSVVESIDSLETRVREGILMTKCVLYDIDSDGWSEERAILSQDGDPLLTMMEALVDYDDIVFNEALYKNIMRSMGHEISIA
ncbi:MAG: hypothetical protein ABSB81_11490 [Halobacteriota archaeon]|jgi:hypothetical protein